VTTDRLAIGAADVSAFAGLGGDTAGVVEIELGQADFALAISKESGTEMPRTWTALDVNP